MHAHTVLSRGAFNARPFSTRGRACSLLLFRTHRGSAGARAALVLHSQSFLRKRLRISAGGLTPVAAPVDAGGVVLTTAAWGGASGGAPGGGIVLAAAEGELDGELDRKRLRNSSGLLTASAAAAAPLLAGAGGVVLATAAGSGGGVLLTTAAGAVAAAGAGSVGSTTVVWRKLSARLLFGGPVLTLLAGLRGGSRPIRS